jgi:hypothetical protein
LEETLFTKRIMLGTVFTFILGQGAWSVLKLWAARHSTHNGVDGKVADAIQVTL